MEIDEHKQEAIDLYKSGVRLYDVANKYGCNAETVRRRFAEWGIAIRPQSAYLKGKKKSPQERERLKKLLAVNRPKALEASKKLWSTFNGERITRAEFLSSIRQRAIEKRRENPPKGSLNGRWKGGKSIQYWKQTVILRDSRECQDCGYNKRPEIIEVHHIDYNNNNNSLENGIVLCPNCHKTRHFDDKTFHTKLRQKRYD